MGIELFKVFPNKLHPANGNTSTRAPSCLLPRRVPRSSMLMGEQVLRSRRILAIGKKHRRDGWLPTAFRIPENTSRLRRFRPDVPAKNTPGNTCTPCHRVCTTVALTPPRYLPPIAFSTVAVTLSSGRARAALCNAPLTIHEQCRLISRNI